MIKHFLQRFARYLGRNFWLRFSDWAVWRRLRLLTAGKWGCRGCRKWLRLAEKSWGLEEKGGNTFAKEWMIGCERCNFLFSTCLTSSEFSGYRRCPTSQLQVPISANGTLQKPGSSLGKRGRVHRCVHDVGSSENRVPHGTTKFHDWWLLILISPWTWHNMAIVCTFG